MYIQIDSSSRVATWNLHENAISAPSDDVKEINVPVGVTEENFNEYVWQSDGTLLHDAIAVDLNVDEDAIRSIRNRLLSSSDWRASIADYPHLDLDAWLTYRQDLRDFPATYIPTENPVWPQPPT